MIHTELNIPGVTVLAQIFVGGLSRSYFFFYWTVNLENYLEMLHEVMLEQFTLKTPATNSGKVTRCCTPSLWTVITFLNEVFDKGTGRRGTNE